MLARDDPEFSEIDLHFAAMIARLAGSQHGEIAAAAALASRATGEGDVCVRLAEFAERELPTLGARSPALALWMKRLRATSVVGAPGDFRPLVLDDEGRLYLYRYWQYERRLADDLLARATDACGVDEKLLAAGLARHFPDAGDAEQKVAAATAVLRRFCVISGGPGTGKTTTVAKILALLVEQAGGGTLRIALAAPTGKAAARVQDAMHSALARIEVDLFMRASIPEEASTIHRLLGARPDSVYYRHDRNNPLPLDVLVLDEASMADLALMAKLVDALPPRARLILLGDKDQLASVEAGAVLGDICCGAGYTRAFAKRLAAVARVPAKSLAAATRASPLGPSVALLVKSHRFGAESGIGNVARLVNAGRGGDALALLNDAKQPDVAWHTLAAAELKSALASAAAEGLGAYLDCVRRGAPAAAIFDAFNAFRVLCAHRSGPYGVGALNTIIEEALDAMRLISARHTWYAGRPVMIARNDYNLRLFNGDVGVTLADSEGRLKVYFPDAGEGVRTYAPARLPEHETVYAMTIHKAQGSEFGRVLMILPAELSPVLSRELVYTGVTRARTRLDVWGSEDVFRAAVDRRLTRASALQELLWGSP